MSELRRKVLDRQLAGLPKEVKFCKKCVVSNQRPRIEFDDQGVCSACRYAEQKQHTIDWQHREGELAKLCDMYRRNDGRWDVLVPVSGGKDSSYVAHKLKNEYGMSPLTVTWAPFLYTEVGLMNLSNFINSGFVNVLGAPNGDLHRKLSRIAFEEVGDNFLPFIFGQYAFVFHTALRYKINLVFYGENGDAEYGGDAKFNDFPSLPLSEWAITFWKGTTIEELVKYGLKKKSYFELSDFTESDLTFYRPPTSAELEENDIQMHWMSYYANWVPQDNFYYASKFANFAVNEERSEGTFSKYASLDDKMDGLHYYMMYIKFGIGRATSDAAHEVRDGFLTREEAVAVVKKYDGEFPTKYYSEALDYLQLTEEQVMSIFDSFRAPHLWEKRDGRWKLKFQVS